ncbi:MAG: ADP-ribosylglycohydrolase family protein, partial [Clostridia bacterium]
MKKLLCMMLVLCFVLASCATTGNESKTSESASKNESTSSVSDIVKSEYRISESDLYDKVLGSWLGQAAGVVWGAKTEFAYQWKTIPEEGVPDISTLNLNDAYGQDDLYVEIPYMDAMKKYGVDCSLDLVAQEFAKTKFPLDHANKIGRLNLQKGIKAPESGSYKYNNHCDDIDWQIEADFLGSIYPALVNEGAARAFELGHITNYGDGVYGGVFVVAMHAAAFYAKNVDEIIDAGISVIPKGTKFREMMDDVVTWKSEGLTWEENWQKLFDKWEKTKRCHWYAGGSANIDAKMNSAY